MDAIIGDKFFASLQAKNDDAEQESDSFFQQDGHISKKENREKRIVRQKRYRERKAAKLREAVNQHQTSADLVQQLKAQNEKLKKENQAMQMLKEYKESMLETLRLSVHQIKSAMTPFPLVCAEIQVCDEYIFQYRSLFSLYRGVCCVKPYFIINIVINGNTLWYLLSRNLYGCNFTSHRSSWSSR